MSRLSTSTLAFLENEIKMYPKIDRLIATRKLEMLEVEHHDENIGGGKGNLISDPTGSLAIRYMEDPIIIKLNERKADVEKLLKLIDSEQESIIKMKYWGTNYYTWNEMADQFYCGSKTMYRKRYMILELLAKIKALDNG